MGTFTRWKKNTAFAFGVLGTMSAIRSNAQTFTTLVSFNGPNGCAPISSLVQGADGNFYGTTADCGAYNDGTVFKITPAGTLTTLYSFGATSTDGQIPTSGVIQASDGNFYGTTSSGGAASDAGTVFRITPQGTETTLYSFCTSARCPDGSSPSMLLQAKDGNFYGIAASGGEYNGGAIFKITSGGTLTTLYSFGTTLIDGTLPGSLIQGVDGNFYGATFSGGVVGCGTVFKFVPNGAETTLYTFGEFGESVLDGGALIQGTDGNFYGTFPVVTSSSFFPDSGTVFKITPSGALTELHNFCGSGSCGGGTRPGGLVQGSDGNLYGTTIGGGTYNEGTIFRITPDGTFTMLYSLGTSSSDGSDPVGLIQGTDGNLYGTTNSGTVFRFSTTPAPYTCATQPMITFIDSAIAYGGYNYFASGTWLEIKGTNLVNPADPRLTAATDPGQWTTADFNGVNAPTVLDNVSVTVNGKPAYVWYLSAGQINVQAPEDTATGSVAITVNNCTTASAPFMFARKALAPGFLAPSNYSANGTQYLVAFFALDGAYVLNTSVGASLGVKSRPAKPGDQVYTYGIGFGDVTPSILPGVIAGANNTLVNPVTIKFGSTPATIGYQGLSPGSVGLYQFNFTVPSPLANGDYQINVTQNGVAVPQTMYLTVQN